MIKLVYKIQITPRLIRLLVKSVMAVLGEFLEKEVLYDLRLALTEACNNVYEHAYNGQAGDMEVRLLLLPGNYVQFDVLDWGKECEPSLYPTIQDVLLPENIACSGRGIYIIQQLMDNLKLQRENGVNLLVMQKNIEEEKWKVCK